MAKVDIRLNKEQVKEFICHCEACERPTLTRADIIVLVSVIIALIGVTIFVLGVI